MPKPVKKTPKVKYADYKLTTLHIPEFPIVYKLKRTYWLLNNLHRLLLVDPTAVNPKQYLELLDEYIKLCDEVRKSGLGTASDRKAARKRMDSKNVAEVGKPVPKAGMGASLPFGLGSGVSAADIGSRSR